ncbi:MAG TPA: hypothetical protein VK928_10015, partial [Longimicrobiales bacterium]|nr:hypothetical protein [Longimicrobiales bacterium]
MLTVALSCAAVQPCTMDQRAALELAIANVEAQRAVLGDAVADVVLTPLLRSLAELQAPASAGIQAERKL